MRMKRKIRITASERITVKVPAEITICPRCLDVLEHITNVPPDVVPEFKPKIDSLDHGTLGGTPGKKE